MYDLRLKIIISQSIPSFDFKNLLKHMITAHDPL